jgi:C4-dicarboxylate-binding protein DctP
MGRQDARSFRLGTLIVAATFTLAAVSTLLIRVPAPGPLVGTASAQAKTYKIRMANVLNPGDPTVDAMTDFKKEVEDKSGGRITVELFSSAQLGSQEEVVEMIKSGAAQIHIASPQYPAKYLPELQVITLPYLFGSPEAFDRALDGAVGAEMSRLVEEKTEFTILAFEEFGLKNVFNRRRPVNTLDDLKGLKLRVINASVTIRTFGALGASPVGMPINEVYSAIQTGVLDGAEQPLNVIRSGKFYEVAKYVSLTGHFYEIALAYANKAFINGLPGDLRTIVTDAAQNMAKKERQAARINANSAREFLTSRGMVVNDIAPAELAKMKAAVRPVYDWAKQQWGAELVTRVLQGTQ